MKLYNWNYHIKCCCGSEFDYEGNYDIHEKIDEFWEIHKICLKRNYLEDEYENG